ncbi:hypothetical protein TNCV_2319841 [Trichonephila clavipes]|nr:hypothetical protein TNCV_2319841 [Trichonephila clavipes]
MNYPWCPKQLFLNALLPKLASLQNSPPELPKTGKENENISGSIPAKFLIKRPVEVSGELCSPDLQNSVA